LIATYCWAIADASVYSCKKAQETVEMLKILTPASRQIDERTVTPVSEVIEKLRQHD
jgi:hypothetical protein